MRKQGRPPDEPSAASVPCGAGCGGAVACLGPGREPLLAVGSERVSECVECAGASPPRGRHASPRPRPPPRLIRPTPPLLCCACPLLCQTISIHCTCVVRAQQHSHCPAHLRIGGRGAARYTSTLSAKHSIPRAETQTRQVPGLAALRRHLLRLHRQPVRPRHHPRPRTAPPSIHHRIRNNTTTTRPPPHARSPVLVRLIALSFPAPAPPSPATG